MEQTIDDVFLSSCIMNPQGGYDDGQEEWLIVEDAIVSHVAASEITLDPHLFGATVNERLIRSKMMTAAGSMTINHDSCKLYESSAYATLFTNTGVISAITPTGITAETLFNIWKIDYPTTARTLEVTTQLNSQGGSNNLSRHFGTSNQMLRYRSIASEFYTDTLFVTGRAQSTWGYNCMQIFVSDKGYVKVYPMSKVSKYPQALKKFAKDVGAPEVLIADPHPVHKSKDVKAFCNQIGTTLKILEEYTQWASRDELYIGLMKEATRKDMRSHHSPLFL